MQLTIWLFGAVACAASADPHKTISGGEENFDAEKKDAMAAMMNGVVSTFLIPRQAEAEAKAEAPPEGLGWLSTW